MLAIKRQPIKSSSILFGGVGVAVFMTTFATLLVLHPDISIQQMALVASGKHEVISQQSDKTGTTAAKDNSDDKLIATTDQPQSNQPQPSSLPVTSAAQPNPQQITNDWSTDSQADHPAVATTPTSEPTVTMSSEASTEQPVEDQGESTIEAADEPQPSLVEGLIGGLGTVVQAIL